MTIKYYYNINLQCLPLLHNTIDPVILKLLLSYDLHMTQYTIPLVPIEGLTGL